MEVRFSERVKGSVRIKQGLGANVMLALGYRKGYGGFARVCKGRWG